MRNPSCETRLKRKRIKILNNRRVKADLVQTYNSVNELDYINFDSIDVSIKYLLTK